MIDKIRPCSCGTGSPPVYDQRPIEGYRIKCLCGRKTENFPELYHAINAWNWGPDARKRINYNCPFCGEMTTHWDDQSDNKLEFYSCGTVGFRRLGQYQKNCGKALDK